MPSMHVDAVGFFRPESESRIIYRVAQKVCYYRESSLNRIKNRQPG